MILIKVINNLCKEKLC